MKEKDEDGYAIRPNKTQLKRELAELKGLVTNLVALPENKRQDLNLDDELNAAIKAAKKMQRSALQRQLRYINGIVKNLDASEIDRLVKQYDLMMLPQQKNNAALHQLEQWRDQLLSGDNDLLEKLVNEYAADRQQLRQMLRNIKKEQAKQPPLEDNDKGAKAPLTKTARLLFKYLQDLAIQHAQ